MYRIHCSMDTLNLYQHSVMLPVYPCTCVPGCVCALCAVEPARIVIFPKSIEVISRMKKPPSLPRVLSNMTAAAATNLTTNSTDANVKSFPCRSRGTRPLHIGWYRNGVLIRTANVSSLPLVLRGNDSDDATYVCRTWNAYGNDSRVVRIIIHCECACVCVWWGGGCVRVYVCMCVRVRVCVRACVRELVHAQRNS